MTKEEYINFMCNSENEFKCAGCPENQGLDKNRADRVYPCGQQNCWVTCHCNREEEAQ